MDFQSKKSFGKLRLRAFQPYHQILCMLKHVEDVEDYTCVGKQYCLFWRRGEGLSIISLIDTFEVFFSTLQEEHSVMTGEAW